MNIDNQLLDTLKSIDRTLKRIAQAIEDDRQQTDIEYFPYNTEDGHVIE